MLGKDGQDASTLLPGAPAPTLSLWPEAAQLIGCGKSKVYELAHEGRLPILKIGRRMRVLRGPLLRMLGAADAA
jgi:excisionase family DNA binding protein